MSAAAQDEGESADSRAHHVVKLMSGPEQLLAQSVPFELSLEDPAVLEEHLIAAIGAGVFDPDGRFGEAGGTKVPRAAHRAAHGRLPVALVDCLVAALAGGRAHIRDLGVRRSVARGPGAHPGGKSEQPRKENPQETAGPRRKCDGRPARTKESCGKHRNQEAKAQIMTLNRKPAAPKTVTPQKP